MRSFALLGFVLAGCFDGEAPTCTISCSADDECPSGLACNGSKCSVGGAACVGLACPSLGEQRCAGGTVEVCSDSGSWATAATCGGECVTDGAATAHCQHVEPTIAVLATACDTPATTGPVVFPGVRDIDTADAGTCTGGVFLQDHGPALCLVRARSFTVAGSAVVRVRGPRALALVADHEISVEGTIDASAEGDVDGPGGGGVTRTSGLPAQPLLGGSGAGFQTKGGDGGAHEGSAPQAGGSALPEPVSATVLVGGFRAGGANVGGGGGGALALIACAGSVSVSGTLDAAGGGGAGVIAGMPTAGSGGGAGGMLLLQGLSITVAAGGLFANGGSGGGGASDPGGGNAGRPGSRSATVGAVGAAGIGVGGGRGGDGGFRGVPPTGGENAISPGGGGGSVGFIIYATPVGSPAIDTSVPVSPAPTITTSNVR